VAVRLRPCFYRDYQPSPLELDDGRPLNASVLLRVPQRNSFPSEVDEAYTWVRNGDQIWSERLSRESAFPRTPIEDELAPGRVVKYFTNSVDACAVRPRRATAAERGRLLSACGIE
jgi:hypothetical protein